MCWCFPFNLSTSKKRNSSSSSSPSSEKKRRERPAAESLHGAGVAVVANHQEKRRAKETPSSRRSKETVTPRSSRSSRPSRQSSSGARHAYDSQYRDAHHGREQYRPTLNVQVPERYHRSVEPESANSSQEMLLNPRPHRSPHHRQKHPKRTSQTTLRGRGAKRDPPRHSKSKKHVQAQSSRPSLFFFAPSPPKTPPRSHRNYQTLDSSPRNHRSSRHRATYHDDQDAPEAAPSQHRQHRSRQHERSSPSSRLARSRTPNTAARRTPDRRFAVLAATNAALEDLRREAFAHPSPPPRTQRTQRYQGVAIPTSTIPFNWDCVSSSQTSAGEGPSTRHRRSRR